MRASGDYLLLLHDAVEVITDEFLDELLPLAAQRDVGAVGCKILSSDGRIHHGGYVFNGNPHPIMQGVGGDHPIRRGGDVLAAHGHSLGDGAACSSQTAL